MLNGQPFQLDTIRNKLTLCHKQFFSFYCEGCGRIYSVPYHCDLMICEKCGKRRFIKLKKRYLPLLKKYHNGLSFLTLTWKKGTSKRNEIAKRHRQTRRLIRKYFKAGIYVFEGLAQHIHAIVLGRFVDKRKISKSWERMTKHSKIIRIKRCNVYTLNYLLKYISKSPSFDSDEEMLEYLRFWYKRRRVSACGLFYNKGLIVKFRLECICGCSLTFLGICEIPYDKPVYREWIYKQKL